MPQLLITAFAIFVTIAFLPNEASSSEKPDFKSLVTKAANGEFDVKGAVKIDHLRAAKLQKEGAVFVDVRRSTQYTTGHIPGAISLELKSMLTEENLTKQVAKDQPVVFYCSDLRCYRSAHASAMAITWGYTKVLYFAGGRTSWLKHGH